MYLKREDALVLSDGVAPKQQVTGMTKINVTREKQSRWFKILQSQIQDQSITYIFSSLLRTECISVIHPLANLNVKNAFIVTQTESERRVCSTVFWRPNQKSSITICLQSNKGLVITDYTMKEFWRYCNNWHFIKHGSACLRSALKYQGWMTTSESVDDVVLPLLLPTRAPADGLGKSRNVNDCCDAACNDDGNERREELASAWTNKTNVNAFYFLIVSII